jgi:uroporphyrin-III C-methyltransferase
MQDDLGSRQSTDSDGTSTWSERAGPPVLDGGTAEALADATNLSHGALYDTPVAALYDTRLDRARAATAVGEDSSKGAVSETPPTRVDSGYVSLIGSGPGHPGLLTRRAWDRIERADVVFHDSLTGDEIVTEIPPAVAVVDVGKRPPDRTSQDEINTRMRDRATNGERVVRLKGGDPNVFGRGGEEAEFLAAHEIPFEVVSGISSVLAASGASGIPLTHRECSSSLTVITGHQTPDKDESKIDWNAIAEMIEAGGTLVILMGVSKLPENVDALREQGVPDDTSVAMVEKVTWNDQRTITATLDAIVERCHEAAIESPAVTIVGDVVDVRERVEDCLTQ